MTERAEDCLAGGGEAGALMRAIDWSRTPLGPVASWPATLRNTVSIMLSSRFAMRILWGPEFIFLYNDAYRPVLGATKHPAAMGSRTPDTYADVWEIVGPMFHRVYAGEAIAHDDLLLPLVRNGYVEECYFTLSYSPLRDDEGNIAGVLGVVHETTERVLAERRLMALRELAGSAAVAKTPEEACETAAATLARHAADAPFALFYLLDAAQGSARLVGAVGVPRGTALAPETVTLGSETNVFGPSFSSAVEHRRREPITLLERLVGEVHAGPYPEPVTSAVVLPLMRPGQREPYGFWVAGVNPRRVLDDKYEGFFELAADHVAGAISNAVAYQDERRRAEALSEIDRQKTAFFSNVSHEFRTPLTLMLGPLSDALGSPTPALTGDNLLRVHRNALRLLKLVNSLLEFSRIEAGRVQARYEPVDLAAMTGELAGAFQSVASKAGLTLTVDCPKLSLFAYVDREMWEKIVLNLLSNAFKFTFAGEIRVSLHDDGAEDIELRVEDTGVGIPEHEIGRLFERFHRVEGTRSRTHEGSGIGLALVQELIKLHGGTAFAASTEGAGSTFTVRLPKGHAHLPKDRLVTASVPDGSTLGVVPFVEEASAWVTGAATEMGTPTVQFLERETPMIAARAPEGRVLLADDNADMRAYIRGLLSGHFVVEEAGDGVVALESARSHPPDLVLTDVMMPNLDGFGLLSELRRDERTRTLPVILLSARAGEESRVEGLESGADDYLVKPFSPRELVARVRTHIELGRLRSQLDRDRRALAEAERTRLYAFLMQAPAGIAILSGAEYVYELANPAYCELAGVRELVGRRLRDALPEAAAAVLPILDDVQVTKKPFAASEFPVLVPRNGVNELIYINFIYQPIEDEHGKIDRIAVVAFDVTVQVVQRRQAERLSQALTISNKDLDQFAYVASHDLKAPLRGIASLAQWIEEGLGDKMDAESVKQMALLQRRVHRLEALIDGILNYSRAGRLRHGIEKLDTGALLAETRDLLAAPTEAQVVIGDSMPTLEAERVPFQQVFLNLIGNAVKHSGRSDVTVHVTVEEEAEAFHFRVTDDGKGILPEYHERIWGIFTTLESRDKVEGTGIGLSVVKKLVEMRGGKVSVDSAPGQGATFHVHWPKDSRHV